MELNKDIDRIMRLFAADNNVGYYPMRDDGRRGWLLNLHIPKTPKVLPFLLLDCNAMDIKYLANLKEQLYDTLKQRLEEAK